MGRRNERRNDDIIAALLMGLSLLKGLAGRSRGARRSTDRFTDNIFGRSSRSFMRPRGLGPIAKVVLMVGALIALSTTLVLLAVIVALVQSPFAALLCAMPVAAVAFLVWALRRNAGAGQATSDPIGTQTIEGHYSEVPAAGDRTATRGALSLGQPAPTVRRERTLEEEYPRKGLRPPGEYRQRAISYRRRIESLLKTRRPGPFAQRIRDVLEKLKNWEERVAQLAERLALFETDDLIQRDLREVPGHIERLRRQRSLEADPEMQQQIERTQKAYEGQLGQLRLLARVMRRTRFSLDDTLAAMGTVYSQVQVLNAMDIDAPAAARIDDDISREVDRLNDLMTALGEVYASSDGAGTATSAAEAGGDDDVDAGMNGRRARLGRDAAG